MNKIATILLSLTLIFGFNLNTSAQKVADDDISIVLPAHSIANFLTKLLPYEVNLGKHFSGSMQIKSISNFKIAKNQISFSSHLYGKDIKYIPNTERQGPSIELGNVNLHNDWEGAIRFDVPKKTLYIRPHLKEQAGAKKENQKGTILYVLFKAFTDIEYPIDLQNIEPVTAEILGGPVVIGFDITSIAAADNKVTVKLIPIPRKVIKNRTPADTKSSE